MKEAPGMAGVGYPSASELAEAEAWAKNPPEKRETLVACVLVPTLLRFVRATQELNELRDLLMLRDELIVRCQESGNDGADVHEYQDVARRLKEVSKELANPQRGLE